MNARSENQSLEVIATRAAQLLSNFLAKNCQTNNMLVCLDSIRGLLDCLPLDTVEYGLANLRIKNAERFLQSNEAGAAKFEIRMLKGSLKNHLESQSTLKPNPQWIVA